MLDQKLVELAKSVDKLTIERRRELEQRLGLIENPGRCAGVVRGLLLAAEAMIRQPEAAEELREMAAVAAVRALEQERLYDQARQLFTLEAHAESLEEIARIERGEVEMVPFEDVLSEINADRERCPRVIR